MSRTPEFATKREKRLLRVEQELKQESIKSPKIVRSTFTLESSLLYAVREIALKRKQAGIQPNTLKDMIVEAFKEIVSKENHTKSK